MAEAAASGHQALSEIDSKRLLGALGLPVAIPQHARTADEAALAATRLGFPVVLKVLSSAVTHKSDAGGVLLGLESELAVREGFARIRSNLSAYQPDAPFDGVAVDRMAKPGVELLVGIVRDPRFGPMVVVGLGGTLVEVFKDSAFRLAPIDKREARRMLDELRGAALLHGARGAKPVDFDAVASLVAQVSDFAASHQIGRAHV